MNKFKILSALSILALAIGVFGFAPSHRPAGCRRTAAAASSIIYNLYATDGFIALADGNAVYNYGFVGGRDTGAAAAPTRKAVTPGGRAG